MDSISLILDCKIGIKEGDVLGPILFSIYIAAIMITWRQTRNHPQCIFRTKNDFLLTGRRPNTGEDFELGGSEFTDDPAVDSSESLTTDAPVIYTNFDRFGTETHAGIRAFCDKK